MSKAKTILSVLIACFLISVFIWRRYTWFGPIVTTTGSHYGFSIGDSKETTFAKARRKFAFENVILVDSKFKSYRSGYSYMKWDYQDSLKFIELDSLLIETGDGLHTIEFKFQNGNVREIVRWRAPFETP